MLSGSWHYELGLMLRPSWHLADNNANRIPLDRQTQVRARAQQFWVSEQFQCMTAHPTKSAW